MAIRRKRTLARAQARKLKKLNEMREKLFRAEPGGSPQRPLEVGSASIVETSAEALGCPRCDLRLACKEHNARTIDSVLLREVVTRCPRCGIERTVWVRIVAPLLN